MATLNVMKSDVDEILRKKSRPVKNFDEDLWEMLDDMRETMVKNNGCGLAGVQVGILWRMFVIDVNNMKLEFINPEITYRSKETEVDVEGCLSVKNISGYVERPHKVTCKAYDRYGVPFEITAEGYLARAICHEYDHLNGVLFTDKMIKRYIPDKEEK